ncbi:hypothetical protein CR513_19217, partial [Mucuna pruriens]
MALISRVRKEIKRSLERTKVLRKRVKFPKLKRSYITYPNSSKSSNIKCFKCIGKGHITSQCLNMSTMVLRENGEIGSSQPHVTLSTTLPLASMEYKAVQYNMNYTQRKYGKCNHSLTNNTVHRAPCSLIIDYETSVNVASLRLVEKLALSILPQPDLTSCIS